jgi:hypothetical protein
VYVYNYSYHLDTPKGYTSVINGTNDPDYNRSFAIQENEAESTDKEITIDQLHKQQKDLLRIKNMIQLKMSNIQSAITHKESKKVKAVK